MSDIHPNVERVMSMLMDDEEVILWPEFDDAIIGVGRQFDRAFVVYDRTACIRTLIDKGNTLSEAEEYFSSNVEGQWSGSATPIVLEFIDD